MAQQRNSERVKNYLRGIFGEVKQAIPPDAHQKMRRVRENRHVDKHVRRVHESYDTSVAKTKNRQVPAVKAYLRKALIGSAKSFTGFLDGEFVPPEKSKKRKRGRPKKQVRKKRKK